MTELIVAACHCRSCGSEMFIGDNFCARCGVASGQSMPAVVGEALVVAPNQGRLAEMPANDLTTAAGALLNNRTFVIAMLVFVGPLGLPLLWFSPRFSKTTKIVTSVAYFLFTIVFPLAMAWYWLDVALGPLLDVFVQSNGAS